MIEERAYSNGFIAPSFYEASLSTPTGSEALLIEVRRDIVDPGIQTVGGGRNKVVC